MGQPNLTKEVPKKHAACMVVARQEFESDWWANSSGKGYRKNPIIHQVLKWQTTDSQLSRKWYRESMKSFQSYLVWWFISNKIAYVNNNNKWIKSGTYLRSWLTTSKVSSFFRFFNNFATSARAFQSATINNELF